MIQVEKNVPMPTTGMRNKYPWGAMEVGDSFRSAGSTVANLRASAYAFSRRNAGKKFAVRAEEGGARAWRVQ